MGYLATVALILALLYVIVRVLFFLFLLPIRALVILFQLLPASVFARTSNTL